ncbi:MAG: ArsR/SmtB family transcription factor [Thalassovita sp.]
MNEATALTALSSISNETRLRMFRLLAQAGAQGMTAGDVASAVGATPSRASFHLAALAEAGLATSQRNARQVLYTIDFQAMGALMRYLLQDCCQGNAVVQAYCTDSCC